MKRLLLVLALSISLAGCSWAARTDPAPATYDAPTTTRPDVVCQALDCPPTP